MATVYIHFPLFHSHRARGSVGFSKISMLQTLVLEHVTRFGDKAFKAMIPLNKAARMGPPPANWCQIQQGNLDRDTKDVLLHTSTHTHKTT